MLISEEYRELNRKLHEKSPLYGFKGSKNAKRVHELMKEFQAVDVLDYGCGKGTLAEEMGEFVFNYDPAVPKWADDPEPRDLVVCADVLEHVEPECLDDVLDHIKRLAKKAAFFIIVCREAKKSLPDGRNTHILIQPPEWWQAKMDEKFKVHSYRATEKDPNVIHFVTC